MTAEIAILNRSAVALAADSAVTLPDAAGGKTYDSAEKIFELANSPPIGLMTYNVAEFMGIPLEVLIREYRGGDTMPSFDTLSVAKDNFFEFSQTHIDNADRANVNFMALLSSEILHLNRFALERSRKFFLKKDQWKIELRATLEERRATAEANRLPDFLTDISFEKFDSTYGDDVKNLLERELYWLDMVDDKFKTELIRLVTQLMFSVVRSNARSSAFTGFVFAGHGAQSLFPALYAVEFDGIYFNQLRLLNIKEISIGVGRGNRSAIVPFAQKDMPQRFIHGIDNGFELKFKRIVKDIVSQYFSKVNTVSANAAEDLVAGAMAAFSTALKKLKEDSEEELKSVVNHLSKNELADVAHSLVELTSRKRRYSSDMETVGGPTDVAILTRNEGFIWVRRKHYFGEELNPRYFRRLRRNQGTVETGLNREGDNV